MLDDDPYKLNRFVQAQEGVFETVISELKRGIKTTHWMWFIFPQLEGLGRSEVSRFYALKTRGEAIAYLGHPLLGKRLVECAEIVLGIEGKSAAQIFGVPDDLKLHSSMTLFALVSEAGSIFTRVLEKYFDGEWDSKTILS